MSLASAYLRTLWLQRRLGTQAALDRHRQSGLRRLIDDAARTTAFYAPFAGAALADLPVVDKAIQLDRFADFNTLGIGAERAREAAAGRAEVPGFEIGASTGTSGLRGLYMISAAERFRWLGTIVAKTIPDIAIRRHRVAIVLPGPSPLYQSANESRLVTLRHVDARRGLACFAREVEAFDPTILLGAPKSLTGLAQSGLRLRLRSAFVAAEVLDPMDARVAARAFGLPIGQVYMATEGLLGTSCREGALHLAEDVAAFELEPIPGDPDLVTPLLTDFTRRTQIMARYRIGDLLRLADHPCACGSPMRCVSVIGRVADLIMVSTPDGRRVPLAPDRVRDALAAADPDLADYRVGRCGTTLRILLPRDTDPARLDRARSAIVDLCRSRGADVAVEAVAADLAAPFDRKLRRIADAPPETL